MSAGAAGHFSSSPSQPSLSWKGFLPPSPSFPRSPHSLLSLARLLFLGCCLVPSYNCFPPGPQASSFSPTALCKGFLAARYVRALDLEVLMRLMVGGAGLGHFPGSSPPPLSSSLPSACPGSPSAGGHPAPPRVPHTTKASAPRTFPFFLHTPPSRLPLPRRNRWFGNVSASPAAGGQGGRGGGWLRPSGTRSGPPPCRPRVRLPKSRLPGRAAASPPRRGQGAARVMPVHGAARRPLAPRYPQPSPARQPSLSAGPSLGSAQPAAERRSVPATGESGGPPAPARDARGGRESSGDEERRALPPRPLAHLQAPHAGGTGAGGRRRAAPGKVHFGAGSRRGFGEVPGAVPAPAVGQLPLSPGLAL